MRSSRAYTAWLGITAWMLLGSAVHAHAQTQNVTVVRATSANVPAEIASSVDDALLQGLAEFANIAAPDIAPSDFDEIQILVGCEGVARECLAQVADTLDAQNLLIRRLDADEGGTTTLELIWFESAGTTAATTAQLTAAPTARGELANAVPGLLRKLFGSAEPRAATSESSTPAPTPAAASQVPAQAAQPARTHEAPGARARVEPLTWLVLVAGAATLGTGIALSASAQSSFDAFKATPIKSTQDASKLSADIDSIETRATIANVVMPLGGVLLGLGGVLLYLDLTRDEPSAHGESARLSITPELGGARVVFASSFGGEW